MPKRILILAATTGYQLRSFEQAARRLSMEVVLATDRCHQLEDPWGDRAIAVRFDDAEASLPAILAAAPFDGVVAVGDRPTVLAALAAARLGLPYGPAAAVSSCRDKYQMREAFRAGGLKVPEYRLARIDDDPETVARRTRFPCVLKPLGLSASQGVIRADDPATFVAAFRRIRAILESRPVRRLREPMHRFLQIESYIPGREFALEGLVTEGRLQPLALFDKADPLEGPYFEETIYVTPSRAPASVQAAIRDTVEQAVRALGLRHSPVHAEMRVNADGVWMLELAARPIGGLCARALEFQGGARLEEVVLRHAVGEDVSGVSLADGAHGVMMIPVPREGRYEGVQGVEDARAVHGIEDVIITAAPGEHLVPLPEGSSYLGFLFARGSAPDEVEAALRAAHQRLSFRIAAVLPVLTT
ncbi:MAG: ATP-grasp domain-containing protein [Bryobacterales bacterium]|nr:ATP-grasp domain-containing protein [Bryobacteraceae bacterium]MDW8354464.1 ATP-grasp domain-containing protein [Bryobacterales bacterium]